MNKTNLDVVDINSIFELSDLASKESVVKAEDYLNNDRCMMMLFTF